MSPLNQSNPGNFLGHKEPQKSWPALGALEAPMGARRMRSGDANAFGAFSWPNRIGSSRGTVSLVALCFTVVVGISLASYITLSSRAMQLSNRSFQAGVSKQLAEVGLEEALRAFNKNDWSGWASNPSGITGGTTAWTLDTTNKRATRTLTFTTDKLGQGTTATVKIRVDNYDANVLGASWGSSVNYRVDDLVGRNGIWYRCIRNHNNQAPPNMNYWVPEGIPWKWDAAKTYAPEDLIVYGEIWYRCKLANTNKPPPFNSSEWQVLTAIYTSTPAWPYVSSGQEALLFNSGNLVRLTYQNWGNNPPYAWRWRTSSSYSFNDAVYYDGAWYRCTSNHTSSWLNYPEGWVSAWVKIVDIWAWSASLNYNLGDVVYHSGTSAWYRCIRANSGQTPLNSSAYWSNTPLFSTDWDSGKQYSQNDTVRYNGIWYLSLQNSNVGQNPSTATSYWVGADTTNTSYRWSSATSYSAGAYRCYGGVWYRCVAATTANANHTPNNTTYWTAAWSNSWGITTGAPVVYAEATVNIPNSPPQKTQLRARIAPAPLFPNAAGATTDLTITTGTGTVDSYDSQLGAYNQTTAPFSVSAPNVSDSAVLAAGSTLAINGTTAVKGYLSAPSLPANISTGTTVKGLSSPVSPNLAPDRLSRSPYVPQFDILPSGGLSSAFSNNNFPKGMVIATPAGSGNTVNLGTPGATTPSRYYVSGDFYIGTGNSISTVNILGPVILYVGSNLRVESGGIIDIATTGSAEIHYRGIFRTYAASKGVNNRTQDPKKLILVSDSAYTAETFLANTTNPAFYGVIYARDGASPLGLEIRTGINIYGALSAKKITFSSEANLHYDTSLRYATFGGVDQPYAVTEWRELLVTEQATMP